MTTTTQGRWITTTTITRIDRAHWRLEVHGGRDEGVYTLLSREAAREYARAARTQRLADLIAARR